MLHHIFFAACLIASAPFSSKLEGMEVAPSKKSARQEFLEIPSRIPLGKRKEAIEKAIQNDIDVNTTDEKGNTILHIATAHGDRYDDIIIALQNGPFNFIAKNNADLTPLDIARAKLHENETYADTHPLVSSMVLLVDKMRQKQETEWGPIFLKVLQDAPDTEFCKIIIGNLSSSQTNVNFLLQQLPEPHTSRTLFYTSYPFRIVKNKAGIYKWKRFGHLSNANGHLREYWV